MFKALQVKAKLRFGRRLAILGSTPELLGTTKHYMDAPKELQVRAKLRFGRRLTILGSTSELLGEKQKVDGRAESTEEVSRMLPEMVGRTGGPDRVGQD